MDKGNHYIKFALLFIAEEFILIFSNFTTSMFLIGIRIIFVTIQPLIKKYIFSAKYCNSSG
jgi:hypothetical protein